MRKRGQRVGQGLKGKAADEYEAGEHRELKRPFWLLCELKEARMKTDPVGGFCSNPGGG